MRPRDKNLRVWDTKLGVHRFNRFRALFLERTALGLCVLISSWTGWFTQLLSEYLIRIGGRIHYLNRIQSRLVLNPKRLACTNLKTKHLSHGLDRISGF
jgi:hypothetical protein